MERIGAFWLTKTLTFELVSSTTETALFLAFYGGTVGTAGAVLAITTAGSMSDVLFARLRAAFVRQ